MKLPFYYIHGDDTDLIERKWLPDLKAKYPEAAFTWLDTSLDDMNIGKIVTEFSSNRLFCKNQVFVVRNADAKPEQAFELASALKENYTGNCLVFLAKGLNQTTKLGKLAKKEFMVHEFSLPEIKPFDMLDALNSKNSLQVLNQCRKLFDNDYNALALYSLVYSHLLLMRQVKEMDGDGADWIARQLKQHPFRIKKMLVANRYWTLQDIDMALKEFTTLGKLLRTWQYDENILLQMSLIKISL